MSFYSRTLRIRCLYYLDDEFKHIENTFEYLQYLIFKYLQPQKKSI